MTTLRTAAQQALEALEFFKDTAICSADTEAASEAITALRAALAEPTVPSDCTDSHQPVGWFEGPFGEFRANPLHRIAWPAQTVAWSIPLYITPPQPQRKPLTDEEIDAEWRKAASEDGFTTAQFVRTFARAIERAHGIGDKDGSQG